MHLGLHKHIPAHATLFLCFFMQHFAKGILRGKKITLDKVFLEMAKWKKLHIVAETAVNYNLSGLQKKWENIRNFFKKGIDFMENLRYNWTVHEHNTKQEV